MVCNNLEGLFEKLKLFNQDIFVIGGGEIYKSLLPYCEKAYVTKVFVEVKTCDKWFPNLDDLTNWSEGMSSNIKNYNGLEFQFCEYINNNPIKYLKTEVNYE